MDYTLKVFMELLESLKEKGYLMVTVQEFFESSFFPDKKVAMLRHDVDRSPLKALQTAIIENKLGLKGTYYFRIVKQSFNKEIMQKIAGLGHEVGYHYEDLALAEGNMAKAKTMFEKNLASFSFLGEVKTICMHGSPLSAYDNRLLWKDFSYKDYGILCEPYFDIDFSSVLYLTDTGRRWDGHKVSVRDKEMKTGKTLLSSGFRFRSTSDIISAVINDKLPGQVMFNFHPHRWNDNLLGWSKELVVQNLKNQVKRLIIKRNNAGVAE